MSNGDARQANLALVQRMYDCFNRDDMNTIEIYLFASGRVLGRERSVRWHEPRGGGGSWVFCRGSPGQTRGYS